MRDASHIDGMRFLLALASVAAWPGLAHAYCVSIPDGAGNAAVHCSDGAIGQLHEEPGGGVSGMIGAQPVTGPSEAVSPALERGSTASGYLNLDLLARAQPPSPPPQPQAVEPPALAPPRAPRPNAESAVLASPHGSD